MKITVTLTRDDLEQTELDEYDLAEAIKELIDWGIFFSEINVEVLIKDAGLVPGTVFTNTT